MLRVPVPLYVSLLLPQVFAYSNDSNFDNFNTNCKEFFCKEILSKIRKFDDRKRKFQISKVEALFQTLLEDLGFFEDERLRVCKIRGKFFIHPNVVLS